LDYLADDVVIYTWHGVVYGRRNAINYLLDFRRYQSNATTFNKWKQVMHCMDASIKPFNAEYVSASAEEFDDHAGEESPVARRRRPRVAGGDMGVARFHDQQGFDSQGYAQFERDGYISSHGYITLWRIPIKQTIVLRDGQIVMINLMKRK
jgi:hypothetical protein